MTAAIAGLRFAAALPKQFRMSFASRLRRIDLAAPPAWLLALLLFAATLAAYFPVLHATGFVWNDTDYVTNPVLRDWLGLWRIWFVVGWTEQHYPALHGAFWFEHRLWGDAPLGYHLINIVFHAGSSCLFALILRRLQIRGAWFAGFLFALHPVCVESVAWISEQKNTLSTLLFLAAALVYLQFDDACRDAGWDRTQRRPRRLYALASAIFLIALLAKSLTATLPPSLLVVFWWRRGTLSWRRDVVPLLPWFVAGAAMGLFSAWVEHNIVGAAGPDFDLAPLQRLLVAGRSTWFYLWHTLWPFHLIFIYPRWHVNPAAVWQWLFPAAVVAITLVLGLLHRRARALLATWLLFTGSLFPVMGFFSLYAFRYSFVADHWQYLPMLPVLALVAAGAVRLVDTLRLPSPWLARTAAALLLAGLGYQARSETFQYHDIITFYRTILARNPDCWMASANLGNIYLATGRISAAATEYDSALHRRPDIATLYSSLGDAYLTQDHYVDALNFYQKAVALNPDIAEIHNNLATAALRLGHIAEALDHFQRALKLNPNYAEARCNFGYLLTQFGQPAAGAEQLRLALVIRPNYPEAADNLGSALLALGQVDKATRYFQQALRLNPAFDGARNNLGNAYARAGRIADAIAEYRKILAHHPADPSALINLGNVYLGSDRLADAVTCYETVVRLQPDMPEAHNNYGFALLRLGHVQPALLQFQRALALRPDYPDARTNLALAQRALETAAPAH